MAETKNNELINTVNDILKRGNDVEIKQSKDGIKVLEINKKLKAVIKN